MIDAQRLLDNFPGGQSGRTADGGKGGGFDLSRIGGSGIDGLGDGALAGGLVGILLGTKQGRRLAGSAPTIGGMTVVGALAYQTYRNWRARKHLLRRPRRRCRRRVTLRLTRCTNLTSSASRTVSSVP